jgi:hypothetical protein
MFDNLSESINKAWKLVQKDGKLTPDNMKEPMKEIRRALLEADVSLPVVRRFVQRIEERALGMEVLNGVSPDVQFVKVRPLPPARRRRRRRRCRGAAGCSGGERRALRRSRLAWLLLDLHLPLRPAPARARPRCQAGGACCASTRATPHTPHTPRTLAHTRGPQVVNDELVALMGSEGSKELNPGSPQVILLAGLQGVGKTTACGKLALYVKKQRKTCLMVATDVYRPAAIDQLVKLGAKIDVGWPGWLCCAVQGLGCVAVVAAFQLSLLASRGGGRGREAAARPAATMPHPHPPTLQVPVFQLGTEVSPVEIARQGLARAKEMGVDVVIVDTAGGWAGGGALGTAECLPCPACCLGRCWSPGGVALCRRGLISNLCPGSCCERPRVLLRDLDAHSRLLLLLLLPPPCMAPAQGGPSISKQCYQCASSPPP